MPISSKEQRYPRISFRISRSKKLRLQALAIDKGLRTTGKLLNRCADCVLDNPDCKALKKVS